MRNLLTILVLLVAGMAGAQELSCKDVAAKTRTPGAYDAVLNTCMKMVNQHTQKWYQLGKQAGARDEYQRGRLAGAMTERARLNGECAQARALIASQQPQGFYVDLPAAGWSQTGSGPSNAPNPFTAAGNPIIAEQQRQEAAWQQERQTRALESLALTNSLERSNAWINQTTP